MIDRMETRPSDRAPIRLPRSFRIRGVMLAIVVIVVWLAVFREWPLLALAILWLSGPTAFFFRWSSKEFERDEGRPPGPFLRMVFLFTALICSVSFSLIVVLVLGIFFGVIAEIASLVFR